MDRVDDAVVAGVRTAAPHTAVHIAFRCTGVDTMEPVKKRYFLYNFYNFNDGMIPILFKGVYLNVT